VSNSACAHAPASHLGIALTPKVARIMERRPNPPGQHGAVTRRKVSDYKTQLLEKQRLRARRARR
jgi:small subunit ribosomal protein S4